MLETMVCIASGALANGCGGRNRLAKKLLDTKNGSWDKP